MSRPKKAFRWVAGVAILAVLAGGGVTADAVLNEHGTRFSARFEATVGLYPGSDVQILGVPVGEVTAVEPEGGHVRVDMELDPGQRAAAKTAAVIVAPTVVSDRYVQLTQPYVGGKALAEGSTITETGVPVEIDDLYRSLIDVGEQLGPDGVNSDGALSRLLEVLAANLDGQGADINRLIGNFGDASGTLAEVDDDFFAVVAHLDKFNSTLLAHDKGVAKANRQLAAVSEYLAEDRKDMAVAIDELGKALAELDDFIRENRKSLRNSVDNLRGPTQVLVNQRESIEEAVRTIPLALQNFVNIYDPETSSLRARVNFNDLTVWAPDGSVGSTSADGPPVLLPSGRGTG